MIESKNLTNMLENIIQEKKKMATEFAYYLMGRFVYYQRNIGEISKPEILDEATAFLAEYEQPPAENDNLATDLAEQTGFYLLTQPELFVTTNAEGEERKTQEYSRQRLAELLMKHFPAINTLVASTVRPQPETPR
jgi:hypothetical protein